MEFKDLIKDKSKLDLTDIRESWEWLISSQKDILIVTIFGDLFLIGDNGEINWLETGIGNLTTIANNIEDFKIQLQNTNNFNNWFLNWLHDDIKNSGIKLCDNQVFSFKKPPILGGDYTFDNIEPTDISVHFHFLGQICKQIKDLPEGTQMNNFKIINQ
jgi:hypothetical protein